MKNKDKLKQLRKTLTALSLGSSLIVSMSGCSNNNVNNITTTNNTESTTEYIETNTTATTEYISPTTEIITEDLQTTEDITEYNEEEMVEITTTETSVQKDDEVIQNINNDKEQIEYLIEMEDIDKASQLGKAFFIKTVDFIFYDEPINGVYFNELTDEAKADIYETFCYIDRLIINFSPNYKENIAEKYQIVKDFANEAYFKSLDAIKKAIGEENYNKIGEIKDNIKDTISNAWDNTKESVEEWYLEFKNN